MKARHIIGIIILVIAVMCFGPMILTSGLQILEIPQHQFKWWYVTTLFAVPVAVLILVGALVIGPGHRVHAIAWTFLGGALYGGTLLLTMAAAMASPEWPDMVASMQAQQGQRPVTPNLLVERPLYLTALFALLGAAGLYLHHVVLKQPSATGGTPADAGLATAEGARPLSVTVLSWFLIVTSTFAIFGYLLNIGYLEAGMSATVDVFGGPSVETQMGWVIATMLLSALCGVFLLRGANWARWLLVAVNLAGLAYNGLISQQFWTAAPGLLWLAIYVYFLFIREPAVVWFSRQGGENALEA